ncbi:MAG TPA: redoxin family protein [Isosphaeraceae bacterium]|nr:redoxin family protein [Isosphaeraceae bacterium]
MRALRTSLAAAWLLGLITTLASAQTGQPAKLPTVAKMLDFRPSQPGVDYDIPTDRAAIDACKVEGVVNDKKQSIGYALRDGQGKLLRKFVNTRGELALDQWSYYQDGFEVYRDVDLDDDLHIDECRWLNTAGSRQAAVSKGRIVGWKRISAEEASKVLVQALVTQDLALLETVMATREELTALGLPKTEVDRVAAAAGQRKPQVNALIKGLAGWSKDSVWLRFDGTMPHLIPADAGLKADLLLYENAVVFVGDANGQGNPANVAFLQAAEVVKVGETWKFVELPRAVNPQNQGQAAMVQQDGGIRASLVRSEPGVAPEVATAQQELIKYDNDNAADLAAGVKRKLAEFHRNRVPILNKLVRLTEGTPDELLYQKQIADSLAAAFQTDLFPEGLKLLDVLIEKGGKVASYAAFRKINAEYNLQSEQPGANPIALQKEFLAKLDTFLSSYGKSDEAPEALYQIASFHEFNGDEEQARKYYARLVNDFPATDPGKKGAGALRRIDLVGKSFVFKGEGLNGQSVDASAARGKTLLVLFWATWAEPSKRDMLEIQKLQQKYKGLDVLAISLDNDKASLEAFLKENSISWPLVFEPGGMDSRPATEFGINWLPTLLLVDAQGKVVNRSLRTPAELEKQLDKLGVEKPVGVARGVH